MSLGRSSSNGVMSCFGVVCFAGMLRSTTGAQPAARMSTEQTLKGMQDDLRRLQNSMSSLATSIARAENFPQYTQADLARAAEAKEAVARQLKETEGKINEIQAVLARYAAVEDPVIASDGFTYERRVLQSYIAECRSQNANPISQQTGESLASDQIVSNASLRRLVECLQAVQPSNSIAPPPPNSANAVPSRPTTTSAAGPALQRPGAAPTTWLNPSAVPYGATGSLATHPCVRVYGHCRFGERCAYAQFPAMACLSFLKGKCRFGDTCHELHPRN